MNSKKYELNVLEILRIAEQDRITYFPAFARCLGNDVGAALFACCFYFWDGREEDPDGWIFKSRDAITHETGMNRKMQEGARKRLIEYGILEEEYRGLPRQLYYRWDWSILATLVSEHFKELHQGNAPAEPKEPVMDVMRRIFDEAYERQTGGTEFNWGTRSERGKQFGNLKKLKGVLAERIASRKTRDAAKRNNGMLPAGFDSTATQEEIIVSWQAFLDTLPDFFRTKRLSPDLLYSDFPKIVLEITNNEHSSPKQARSSGPDIAAAI